MGLPRELAAAPACRLAPRRGEREESKSEDREKRRHAPRIQRGVQRTGDGVRVKMPVTGAVMLDVLKPEFQSRATSACRREPVTNVVERSVTHKHARMERYLKSSID